MESIGFKEWSLVCDALGRGEQCIILRKGGIAEGRGGFSFRHREFFLFPTFFHEQIGKVRNASGELPELSEQVTITLFARVEQALQIDSLETALALAPLHVFTREVVVERFGFKNPGLNVAFVRVFRLDEPWSFPNEKRFAGCRSWIDLPELPPSMSSIQPALDDQMYSRRRAEFEAITR